MISITVPSRKRSKISMKYSISAFAPFVETSPLATVRVITTTVSTRPYANSAAAPASEPSTAATTMNRLAFSRALNASSFSSAGAQRQNLSRSARVRPLYASVSRSSPSR